jgi:hypothetical protein
MCTPVIDPFPKGLKRRTADPGRLFDVIRYGRGVVDASCMQSTGAVATRGETTGSRPYADALLHLSGLAMVAGGIHAVVAAHHFGEYWLFGAGFVAMAAAQLGWGTWVYARPSRPAFGVGLALAVGIGTLWLVSRTAGLPIGPDAWRPEAVGVPDLAATGAELLTAGLCAAFLRTDESGLRALPSRFRPLAPLAIALMMAGLGAMLLGSGHAH